jgi:hypothetical protein
VREAQDLPHLLRAAFGTHWMALGRSVLQVERVAGWAGAVKIAQRGVRVQKCC